ncbi:MAG: choice-of-anchor B family protein [Gemmatimonadota bacterium]
MRKAGIAMSLAFVVAGFGAEADAQQFGAAAVTDGRIVAVAEPVVQDEPATIYVFTSDGSAWSRVATIMAPEHEGGDFFGRFMALTEDEFIVGGTTIDDSHGGVWVYQRNPQAGPSFKTFLRPEAVEVGSSFGRYGLVADGLLFVSALGHNERRGAVHVFHKADGEWVHEAVLSPAEADASEFFGWGLAYADGRLLSGALQASQELQTRGAAYIYRRSDDGTWEQEARLSLAEDDAAPGDTYGGAVAWMDGLALIGAPGRDGGKGEVYTYSRDAMSGAWQAGPSLAAFDRWPGARFGSALLPRGDELWVGAPGAAGSGRIYRYPYDGGEVGMVSKISSNLDTDSGDGFGGVLAQSPDGELVIVGQTADDSGLGSAIVLTRDGDAWTATDKLLGPTEAGLPALVGNEIDCASGTADQFGCNNVSIRSFLPVSAIGGGRGANTNDVWGWTDPETGAEIAIIGRTDGTAFIDVSDANNPVYLGSLPKTAGSISNAWRDVKVYRDHAYIVADGAGNHGMQVFDLRQLRDVQNAPAVFEETAHYGGIASAHNIVINEETGFAYSVGSNGGGETCGGAYHMIDIRNPATPSFAGCFGDTNTGNAGTGYSHDAMCIVYNGPDADHVGKEVCFGSNENALSIADVTDKENPSAISSADYPNVGYAHQGWITGDHRYFYMDDEGDESASVQAGEPMEGTRTLIWDVSDLDDPIMVKEHFGETFTIDHNLYIKDNLMYQSNYVSGLRILDISDPHNPVEVGFLDTVPWSEEVEFDGSWSNYPFFESGTIVVSSGAEGVFFLKYNPQELVP